VEVIALHSRKGTPWPGAASIAQTGLVHVAA
jgi:hypothetical protein